jgi:Ca-activated chloride channel family protein
MNDLSFVRGQLWPLLLCLPLLFALLWALLAGTARAAAAYGARTAELPSSPRWRALRLSLLAGLCLLTWMDPRLGVEPMTVEKRGLDLIFCLDTSRSMLARDLEPSRLLRALQDIKSVLPSLIGGDRAGLVVFAGDARLWVPLTHDIDSFRGLLDEVDTNVVPTGGTDIQKALRKCQDLAVAGQSKTTAVLLLTDGEDLAGAGRQAAAELGAAGIVVHAIGYGDSRGSKITVTDAGKEAFLKNQQGEEVVSAMDVESLRAVAQATGGEFLRADSMPLPLAELYKKRLQPMLKRSYDAGEETSKKARYQWCLLPALLLLLVEIATLGGRRR